MLSAKIIDGRGWGSSAVQMKLKIRIPRKQGGLWHISTIDFIPELVSTGSNDKRLTGITKGSIWYPDYLSFEGKSGVKEER